jgi:hypothetical protein
MGIQILSGSATRMTGMRCRSASQTLCSVMKALNMEAKGYLQPRERSAIVTGTLSLASNARTSGNACAMLKGLWPMKCLFRAMLGNVWKSWAPGSPPCPSPALYRACCPCR